jgi:two-component system chemotaxis sensor kinase CheA
LEETDEVIQEFLVECHEGLDRLDQEFVQLEQEPGSTALLASIFRTIHTIKGTCGFLGFHNLQGVTHAGETLLARLRDGQIPLTQERVDALLMVVDVVRYMLSQVESTGTDGEEPHSDLVEALLALTAGEPDPPEAPSDPVLQEAEAQAPIPPDPGPSQLIPQDRALLEPVRQDPVRQDPIRQERSERSFEAPHHAVSLVEQSVRVDVELLDKLMNLVGELVLARNQLQQHGARVEDPGLIAMVQRLDLITTELQEGMMKTRMQTVGSVWNKLPRLARDVASRTGKQVRIELEGEQTEVDRTLLEAIRDPLTHIVRNAIDHGIEPPARRIALGKPPEGCVSLRAWHEGGQVNLEIRDDGQGIPVEKIRAKVVAQGLVSPEVAAHMSEREVVDLVFLPGFSTADQVTSVSGRGVGMDVVRTNLAAVGGTVDISSAQGLGTILRVRVPLTLAIIPALLVHAAGEQFAIPQVNVLQLLKVDAESSFETMHAARVFRYRDTLLPLLVLAEELGLEGQRSLEAGIVVLQAGERRFGLLVDRVGDCAEIVVKPLARALKAVGVYAGTTITGDGGVALILDIVGIGRRARLSLDTHDHRLQPATARAALGQDLHRLLLVVSPDDGRAAIALDRVERLEEIPASSLESMGDMEALRYRGGILPIVRLRDLLRDRRRRPRVLRRDLPRSMLPVVVLHGGGRAVGLVVEGILDIMELPFGTTYPATRNGVAFSTVIGERVTEVLDMDWIVRQVTRRWVEGTHG